MFLITSVLSRTFSNRLHHHPNLSNPFLSAVEIMAAAANANVSLDEILNQITFTCIKNGPGDFFIKDADDVTQFAITSSDSAARKKRTVSDQIGISMLELSSQNWTAHGKWIVYSSATEAGLFTVERANIIQRGTDIRVFDRMIVGNPLVFQLKGHWSTKNCRLFKIGCSTPVAQFEPLGSKERFLVKICSDMDAALVVALIAIADASHDNQIPIANVLRVSLVVGVNVAGILLQN